LNLDGEAGTGSGGEVSFSVNFWVPILETKQLNTDIIILKSWV
jgi:hypothetical protein